MQWNKILFYSFHVGICIGIIKLQGGFLYNGTRFYIAIIIGVVFVLFCMISILYLTCCADVWGKGIRERECNLVSQSQ